MKIWWYPLLFALFPPLFLYAINSGEVFFKDTIPALLIITLITFLVWFFVGKLLKNENKTLALLSVFLIFFFSYGAIYDFVLKFLYFEINGFNVMPRFTYPIVCILLVFCLTFLLRTKSSLKLLNQFFLMVFSLLFIMAIARIIFYEITSTNNLKRGFARLDLGFEDRLVYKSKFNRTQMPDVYYFIFDRYANNKTLKEYFDFDNSKFIQTLKNEKFYVASDSKTNYPATYLSLASSLNFDYINKIDPRTKFQQSNLTNVYRMIEHHRVGRIFEKNGYQYIHIGSRWEPTRFSEIANVNVNFGYPLNRFNLQLLKSTLLFSPLDMFVFGQRERQRVVKRFEYLKTLPKTVKGPKFVFAHILLPHPPYEFRADGSFISETEANKRSEKTNYLDQLQYVNLEAIALVKQIIKDSQVPPIIIIQSDEGPYIFLDEHKNLKSESQDWKNIRERILNAYYFPYEGKEKLHPSISPVNTFRLVFNSLFQTGLPLLPDRTYPLPEYASK